MDFLWACTIVVLLIGFSGTLTTLFFPRLNPLSDFVVVSDSSQPNVQVHVTRQHVDAKSHAVINFA